MNNVETLYQIMQSTEKAGLLDLDEVLASSFFHDVRKLLTLDYERPGFQKEELSDLYQKVSDKFGKMLQELQVDHPEETKERFLSSLPEIRHLMDTSVDAILEGDPAVLSKQQIVLEYPGFKAILSHRIAHVLYQMNLKMLARYISEDAHRRTGIDINPGATIGDHFFIDHGTGIVIGETAVIGSFVKIYQGVTLGALSLSKGRLLKGMKRHPTIEDHVTIYSNAAIFGGDTIIGEGSTIGAVVYLTRSVPKRSIVTMTKDGIKIVPKCEREGKEK